MTEETVLLNPGETVEDLQRDGYRIIQQSGNFRFGIDAALLAWFSEVKPEEEVIDLCSGTGVVMLLMDARNHCGRYTALEIQPEMADTIERSIALNRTEDHMKVVNGDVRTAGERFGPQSFDVVTVNPPYLKKGSGKENPESAKAVSRHEILLTLAETVRESAKLLKTGGRFYMVHRAERSAEVLSAMRDYRLAPEKIVFVHSFQDKDAALILVSGIKEGRNNVRILPPVVLYDRPGEYSEKAKSILYD